MRARGLHRILGSVYTHFKPSLCPACAYRRPGGGDYGVCAARGTILCCPRGMRNRCSYFEPLGSQPSHDAEAGERRAAGLVATLAGWEAEARAVCRSLDGQGGGEGSA